MIKSYIHLIFILILFSCCDPVDCSPPGSSVLYYLLEFAKLMSVELVMPFNHPNLCRPLLILPSFFSSIRFFSNEPEELKANDD